LATAGILTLMALVGIHRIQFETDIVATLPERDPVVAAARDILRHHPGQDLVAVDLHLPTGPTAALARLTNEVAEAMAASGLFKQVGMKALGDQMPALIQHLIGHLPILFTKADLDTQVAPLLTAARIRERLTNSLAQLASLEGIGQAQLIAGDPLALHHLLVSRLARLAPAPGVRPFQGHMRSADGRHVLVVATPAQASTDTAFARQIEAFFTDLQARLTSGNAAGRENGVVLTPVGAYRAALDNELMARRDTRRIVVFAMGGIALLLFLTFPRPWIGLLAFIPALAGTITALFSMSFWQTHLSILTLGFGGAVISITVDHGIAYLLFLDRSRATRGRDAAREVRAVGLIATLTTVGAFLALSFSGFPVLGEIGRFTALGIGSAFLFVHLVMPLLIPSLPAAGRRRLPVLQRLLARGAERIGLKSFWGAVGVIAMLALFASPQFKVDLRAMNSVTAATRAAETQVQAVWGQFMSRAFVVTRGQRLEDLIRQGDAVAALLEEMTSAGALAPGFLPAAFFPGPGRAEANQAAWHAFWTPQRVAVFSDRLQTAGASLGFAEDAFAPFLRLVGDTRVAAPLPDPAFFQLLGIVAAADGSGWRQFYTLKPAGAYDAASLYERLAQTGPTRLFDPGYFAARLGSFLATTFREMLLVVGASAIVLLALFFCDLTLTALALLPLAGALVGTLGVLGLAGRPLDIPALMLAIIVLGMGIDYALFTIRAYQRYGRTDAPELRLFRSTVFLAAASTLVGFGALMSAEHAVFQSAGLTSFAGILFSALGAFILLPPLLRRLYDPPPVEGGPSSGSLERRRAEVRKRFRHLEIRPRWAAWRKLREGGPLAGLSLPQTLAGPALVYPVGFGVEAAWLQALMPGANLVGGDPDAEKLRVTRRVCGDAARLQTGGVDILPELLKASSAGLVLLPGRPPGSAQAARLLTAANRCLTTGGRLIVFVQPEADRRFWRAPLNPMGGTGVRPLEAAFVEAFFKREGFRQITRSTPTAPLTAGWMWAEKTG
jgi:predicted exporter